LFLHHEVPFQSAKLHWDSLKKTISKVKAYQATAAIGELVAEDMLDFASKSTDEIDRIYVKFRDGMPMAAGMKRKLPHVDVRYIVSQLKQPNSIEPDIQFWDGYDEYSSETLWFADPVNATGRTAIESLRFVRKHFNFDTVLISHVVANTVGIKRIQTSLDDFNSNGFMNYAYLSKKLDPKTGYLIDGLEMIPDFGDKVWGTLGDDYSVWDIQKDLNLLVGTQAGNVELVKGTILHLVQIANSSAYRADRGASWVTRNWISAAIRWYCTVGELPFEKFGDTEILSLIEDLWQRDFLSVEMRPWKKGYAKIYSTTDDGVDYVSRVYLPVMHEKGILQKLQKHFDFLIFRRPDEIEENIRDVTAND